MELLPPQQIAFQRMLDVIRRGFERFGFLPVETPVFELTDILLTKSGGETEKQVYFVQSTGALERDRGKADAKLPEMALRFDLTVPLARYVAEHEHELNFPFRRYQIQRVYRGERNQKGRYREFYQCDIDAVGKDSLPLAYDAEMPAVIYGVFEELAFGAFTIYINNRKLLRGILESYGISGELQAPVLHEVDRLGKQDRVKVEDALATLGLAQVTAQRLLDTLTAHAGDSRAILKALHEHAEPNPTFAEGLAELERVYEGTLALGVPDRACKINLAIVRGLDYYTGTIYETFLDDHVGIGSVCSGGRYENLAGHYTKSKLPGVGISIGATRLFYQLMEAKLIEATKSAVSDVIVLAVEHKLVAEYAAIATELRKAGLNVEVYGGEDKLAKQFKYADRANIGFAVVLGARELENEVVKVKDLRAKAEHEVPRKQLVKRLAQWVQAGGSGNDGEAAP
jgi:histidyl-tRNA synthetase